jgi:hypothetical protein
MFMRHASGPCRFIVWHVHRGQSDARVVDPSARQDTWQYEVYLPCRHGLGTLGREFIVLDVLRGSFAALVPDIISPHNTWHKGAHFAAQARPGDSLCGGGAQIYSVARAGRGRGAAREHAQQPAKQRQWHPVHCGRAAGQPGHAQDLHQELSGERSQSFIRVQVPVLRDFVDLRVEITQDTLKTLH